MKESLLIITNLYPLPWEPNRATFNRQQFSLLDNKYNKSILIPVAFSEWFKHRKEFKQSENLRYVPYFYTPKIGRRFYSVFLFLSIMLHSGLWIKRKKAKIMLASWAFPDAVATQWISQLFSTKFFFKVHGSDINEFAKIKSRSSQITSAAQKALGIISVSHALKKEMVNIGISEDKIEVIYNGVDHEKFGTKLTKTQKNIKNTEYILYIGNLKKNKGIFELLKGFAQIKDKYPTLKLLYAGPGSLKEELYQQAKNLDIHNNIELLGPVNHSELPSLIQNAKLLALPSYNEGVPNVVLESMACGTPVLVTSVGGIPEVVDESICGVIIPPQNSNAVAQGLIKLLNKKWDAKKIQQHSQQFSWEKNKSQLIEVLSK